MDRVWKNPRHNLDMYNSPLLAFSGVEFCGIRILYELDFSHHAFNKTTSALTIAKAALLTVRPAALLVLLINPFPACELMPF